MMDLFLHCGNWHFRDVAKTENPIFEGEAFPVAWNQGDLKTNGGPTHKVWVNGSDKLAHPVRCVLPLQGDETMSTKDRVVKTLTSVSLQLIPQPQATVDTVSPVSSPVMVDDDPHDDH